MDDHRSAWAALPDDKRALAFGKIESEFKTNQDILIQLADLVTEERNSALRFHNNIQLAALILSAVLVLLNVVSLIPPIYDPEAKSKLWIVLFPELSSLIAVIVSFLSSVRWVNNYIEQAATFGALREDFLLAYNKFKAEWAYEVETRGNSFEALKAAHDIFTKSSEVLSELRRKSSYVKIKSSKTGPSEG